MNQGESNMIVELTKFLVSATTYLDAATAQLDAPTQKLEVTPDAPKAPAKRARTRKAAPPKASGSTEAPPTAKKEPAGQPAEGLTEEQSATEVLVVAKAFVQRFQKATPDGMNRARAILADDYNAGKIGDLKHEERLSFIAKLTEEMGAGV